MTNQSKATKKSVELKAAQATKKKTKSKAGVNATKRKKAGPKDKTSEASDAGPKAEEPKKEKVSDRMNKSVVDEFKEELAKHVKKEDIDKAFNSLIDILGKDSKESQKARELKDKGASFLKRMEATVRRIEKSSKQVAEDIENLCKDVK